MAERSMLKKKGSLPMCIVRPAIVGAAIKEPFVGWTDTISALGAPIFFGGIGIYNYQVGHGKEHIDVVAVDQCVNTILLTTCYCAHNPSKLHVFNHSSTFTNPLTQLQWN
jgi:hypothetical protein